MRARALWKARWNLTRLLIAAILLWVLAAGTGGRLARLQLAALPDADLLAEARDLRARGHYSEALVVCDAALAGTPAPALAADLARERAEIAAEQNSLMRRLKDVARGAITGGGPAAEGEDVPDPSLELLAGAVATDLFVVGDIRDLVIQASRFARGRKTDPVIIALSGIGIATTVVPAVDWAPALLKTARKAGAMSEGIASFIRKAAAERRTADIIRLADDAAEIARHASPAGAIRLMKHADSADDAAHMARFLARSGAPGALALKATGPAGLDLVRTAENLRAAGRVDDALAIERTLVKVGAKGKAGERFLRAGGLKALARVHPLVGIAKSVWKGNAEALIRRALEALDPTAAWTLPAAAAWVFAELALLARRSTTMGKSAPRPTSSRRTPVARPA